MESQKQIISEYALEVVCTRMDKINLRLVIALILTIILLFVSNAIWVYAYIQFDYETVAESVTIDTGDGGDANYADNGGNVVNGQNNSYESSP